MLHATFAQKTFHEQRPGQLGQHLGSDATAEINTSRRHDLQSQVPGFRPIDRHKEIERLLTESTLSVYRRTGDCCRRIRMQHFVRQPLWLDSTPGIAQKIEDVDQSRPGDNPLITDVTETHAKVAKKLGLQFVARSQVSVTPFTSKHMMLGAVPIHSSFAQASTG